MRNKKIYWLIKDEFEDIAYDEPVKLVKEIDERIFLVKFKRYKYDVSKEKTERSKCFMLAEKIKEYNNIVFVKWFNSDQLQSSYQSKKNKKE